jgi:ketosteroid isomerase-like protein
MKGQDRSMNSEELSRTVRMLADKEAIRDLARLYAHYVWHQDADSMTQLFTEDGEMDTSLEPPIKGRAALAEAFQRLIGNTDFQPFVHNHVVELDGDQATGTCYVDLRAIQDGKSMIGSGFYRDCYVRSDGAWKIYSRSLELRFFVPLEEGWVPEPD